jgi:hypothetical protein
MIQDRKLENNRTCSTMLRMLRSHSSIWQVLAFAATYMCYGQVSAAEDPTDKLLRGWISRSIYVSQNQNGSPSLFVRKQPIRAHIRTDIAAIHADASTAITSLAKSFKLGHEFTSDSANLIVATASSIADGDKPSRILLHELGLPERAIDQVAASSGWSTGCGVYVFGDRFGQISGSIAVADERLSSEKLRDCIVFGIVYGFGVGVKERRTFDAQTGFVPYVILASVLSSCIAKLESLTGNVSSPTDMERMYVDCAFERLRVGLLR